MRSLPRIKCKVWGFLFVCTIPYKNRSVSIWITTADNRLFELADGLVFSLDRFKSYMTSQWVNHSWQACHQCHLGISRWFRNLKKNFRGFENSGIWGGLRTFHKFFSPPKPHSAPICLAAMKIDCREVAMLLRFIGTKIKLDCLDQWELQKKLRECMCVWYMVCIFGR